MTGQSIRHCPAPSKWCHRRYRNASQTSKGIKIPVSRPKNYFPIPLDNVPVVFYLSCHEPGKEGTMSRSFSHCRVSQQRLQGSGANDPVPSGSPRSTPRTLRPERLHWLSKPGASISGPAKHWLTGINRCVSTLGLVPNHPFFLFPSTYWHRPRQRLTPPPILQLNAQPP
jgi:hypothetical protein